MYNYIKNLNLFARDVIEILAEKPHTFEELKQKLNTKRENYPIMMSYESALDIMRYENVIGANVSDKEFDCVEEGLFSKGNVITYSLKPGNH
jgi:hypothetical protein